MNIETLKQLYAYNHWANKQVWKCVTALPEADYLAEHDYSIGSVFEQCFHMMQSEWWAIRMMEDNVPPYDDPAWPQKENFKDRDTLWKKWQEVNAEFTAHLEEATDADLQKLVKMPVPEGYDAKQVPMWELHMIGINHGTNHRAQVLALLHKRGGKTVEQGYYFYALTREATEKSTA